MIRSRRSSGNDDLDLLRAAPPVRTRRPRRQALATTGIAALAVVAAASAPAVVSGARQGVPAAAGSAAHARAVASGAKAPTAPAAGEPVCPTASTFPAPDGSGSYTVVIKADINNLRFFAGWSEFGQGWQTQAYNISAKTCGLLEIPSLAVTIAPEGIVFDTSREVFTAGSYLGPGRYNPAFGPGLPGSEAQFHLVPVGTSVTSLSGVRPDGTVDVAAATTATAHLLSDPTNTGVSFDCPTTTTTTLTTGRSTVVPKGRGPKGPTQVGGNNPAPWTLEGKPLTGPIQNARALVVANNFPVPIFNQDFTDPANKCGFFAAEFNGFAGGVDADAQNYFTDFQAVPADKVVQPPGDTWVTGELEVTYIDPAALPDGPPPTVPGT